MTLAAQHRSDLAGFLVGVDWLVVAVPEFAVALPNKCALHHASRTGLESPWAQLGSQPTSCGCDGHSGVLDGCTTPSLQGLHPDRCGDSPAQPGPDQPPTHRVRPPTVPASDAPCADPVQACDPRGRECTAA